MRLRHSSALLLFTVASLVSAQTSLPTEAPAAAIPAVPVHACVKPDYPGRNGSDLQIRTFNRDYKTYSDCMRKYTDTMNSIANAHIQAANNAIKEYNDYNIDLKAKIDESKK